MTNLEKYDRAFIRNLEVTKEELPGLRYRGIEAWDSVGHMELVADLEEEFDIQLDTVDLLAFSSYEKGIEIMKSYGVEL